MLSCRFFVPAYKQTTVLKTPVSSWSHILNTLASVVSVRRLLLETGFELCGIKRILSEDKIQREESPQLPEWLCCTRYQPPRLPRATNACRARRSGRHARVPFTGAQAAALEAAYSRSPYLAPPALRALAAALQLRDDRIKIWFQNRRARERRERTGTITPPKAVALPSTTQRSILPNEIWIPNQSQTHYSFKFTDTQKNNAARTDQSRSLHNNKYAYSSIGTSDDESNESSLDIETIID